MSINFDFKRMLEIKELSKKWWAGEISGPWLQSVLYDAPTSIIEPELYRIKDKGYMTFLQGPLFDLNLDANIVADCLEYELSRTQELGYGIPFCFPNFGPGSLAMVLTEELIPKQKNGTVWFHKEPSIDINNFNPEFNVNSVYLKRKADVFTKLDERFGKSVQISSADWGGILDVLVSFRKNEDLLMDLYDNPDSVKNIINKLHNAWFDAYNYINDITKDNNVFSSMWDGFVFPGSYAVLQCDFSAMISPSQFEEFVLPELKESASKFDYVTYHLDGPGEIPHLDMLLNTEEIDVIQWIPTKGPFDSANWKDLYKRCLDKGKKIMLINSNIEIFEDISKELGVNNILWNSSYSYDEKDRVQRFLDKYIK